MAPAPAVELAGVCVHTGGRSILSDVTFRVSPGEVVALVGPSGSGKTTILTVMCGLRRPTSGFVSVCGVDVTRASDRTLARLRARRVGMVFQSFHLMPGQSALDNVMLPAFFGEHPAPQMRARARHLLEQVGLGELMHEAAIDLSEGQRQRVAIARALLAGPSLVLADEPTGNLDDAAAATILSLLEDGARKEAATLILATHDRRCLARVTRTLRVDRGRVEAP